MNIQNKASFTNSMVERRHSIRSPWPQLQVGKLLTDQTIQKWQDKGWYDGVKREERKEDIAKRQTSGKRAKTKLNKEKLLKLFWK